MKQYILPLLGIIMFYIVLIWYFLVEEYVAMTTLSWVFVLFEPGMGKSGGARMSMYLGSVSLWTGNILFGHGIVIRLLWAVLTVVFTHTIYFSKLWSSWI